MSISLPSLFLFLQPEIVVFSFVSTGSCDGSSPKSCSILFLLITVPTNLGRSSATRKEVRNSCTQHSRRAAILKAFSIPMVSASIGPIGSLRLMKRRTAVIIQSSTRCVWPRCNKLCGRKPSGAKPAVTFLIASTRIALISHRVESVNTDIHCSVVRVSCLPMLL
jgi:hypothetical protein